MNETFIKEGDVFKLKDTINEIISINVVQKITDGIIFILYLHDNIVCNCEYDINDKEIYIAQRGDE